MSAPLCAQHHAALSSKRPPALLPLLHPCVHSSPRPNPLPQRPRGAVSPADLGDRGRLWHGTPCGGCGGPGRAPSGAAAESPRLCPLSCSNGVPVPRHGDSRGLPRGTLTGTRTCCLQHLPGCAAAATHPHLRRVSTQAAGGTAPGHGACLPPSASALPGSRASGTGCSSPSTCLASGAVNPPRLLPLGVTCALTTLLCPRAPTVTAAVSLDLMEILSPGTHSRSGVRHSRGDLWPRGCSQQRSCPGLLHPCGIPCLWTCPLPVPMSLSLSLPVFPAWDVPAGCPDRQSSPTGCTTGSSSPSSPASPRSPRAGDTGQALTPPPRLQGCLPGRVLRSRDLRKCRARVWAMPGTPCRGRGRAARGDSTLGSSPSQPLTLGRAAGAQAEHGREHGCERGCEHGCERGSSRASRVAPRLSCAPSQAPHGDSTAWDLQPRQAPVRCLTPAFNLHI